MEKRKRVLIVAAEFPPFKTIGRIRTLKLCQHLLEWGWSPLVLTVSASAEGPYDELTLAEIPSGLPVYRAHWPQPENQVIRLAKRLLGKPARQEAAGSRQEEKKRRQQAAGSGEEEGSRQVAAGSWDNHKTAESRDETAKGIVHSADLPSTMNSQPSTLGGSEQLAAGGQHENERGIIPILGKVKTAVDRFITRNILIPDDWLLWTVPAVATGKRICREQGVSLLFTTAPPFTDLLVGRFLKAKTGLPWVADYRDLWTGDVLRDWVPQWRRRSEIAMEKWALSKADAVIAVSEPKMASLRERLGKVPAERFFTVTNGYDPEEYAGINPVENSNGLVRFVYTGRLFKNRRGYELIEAAGALFKNRPELRRRFHVEYYGGVSPEIRSRLDELASRFDLAKQLHFFPDVPYARSKELQVQADVLLLIVDTGETTSGVIPGKLFEYVAAGRPILCIAAPGATSEIIERGRLGWVTEPGNVLGLSNVLESLLSNNGNGTVPFCPNREYLSQFQRRELVGRMAEIFNKISQAHSA